MKMPLGVFIALQSRRRFRGIVGLAFPLLFPPHSRLLVIGRLSSRSWHWAAVDLKMGGGRRGGGIFAVSGQTWWKRWHI